MNVDVKVIPKARRNAVEAQGDILRIYVTAAPEDGKANAAVIGLLAKHFSVPKSLITITKGLHSRHKTINIEKI